MNIKLVSYDREERTVTIQVGQKQKTISGLGDMNRDELLNYLHTVAKQEFSNLEPLEADLSDLQGKNLPELDEEGKEVKVKSK